MTYKIIRIYRPTKRGSSKSRVIKTGLTLEEAQAHCQNPYTESFDYFDGYHREN